MRIAPLVRTVILRMATEPIAVLVLFGLLSAWPVLISLAPLGISSGRVRPDDGFKELAFLGMASGAVLATGSLRRLAPLLARQPPGSRLVSEIASLAGGGVLGAGVALAPVLALARIVPGSLDPGFVLQFLPALAATAAAGAVFLRLPAGGGLAPWLLAASLVLAPLALPSPAPPLSLGLLALGLLLAAWLLDHPPRSFA